MRPVTPLARALCHSNGSPAPQPHHPGHHPRCAGHALTLSASLIHLLAHPLPAPVRTQHRDKGGPRLSSPLLHPCACLMVLHTVGAQQTPVGRTVGGSQVCNPRQRAGGVPGPSETLISRKLHSRLSGRLAVVDVKTIMNTGAWPVSFPNPLGLCRSSIKRYLSSLQSVFRGALREGRVQQSFAVSFPP